MEDRMEEVLQRVQFKFASIIGELCSEPIVLSQFAVWVDMRISEYKLKGSISLDCSGETPDPIWLKGITYAITQKLKRAQKDAESSLSKGIGMDRIRRPRAGGGQPSLVGNSTLSYTGNNQEMAIKDEPHEDNEVFPVDLYANSEKASESPSVGAKRKRPSSANVAQDSAVFPSTDNSPEINEPLLKLSRLSSGEAQAAGVEPENTSLLSIIGLDHSGQDSSELTLQETDSEEISIILDNSSLQDAGTMHPGDTNLSQSSSLKNTSYARSPAYQGFTSATRWQGPHKMPSHNCQNIGSNIRPNQLTHQRNAYQLCQMRSYVRKFQSWALQPPRNEIRKIETIPPEELDAYLASFFTTIKRDTGGEYGYQSLITLRAALDRHLRQQNYQYSLRESKEFLSSRKALKARKTQAHGRASQNVPKTASSIYAAPSLGQDT